MDEWDEYSSDIDTTESLDVADDSSMDFSETVDVSETLDSAEDLSITEIPDIEEASYVDDVMDSVSAEDIAFDDEVAIEEDYELLEESYEVSDSFEDESTVLEAMDDADADNVQFDDTIEEVTEQIDESYEATPNSEIEILQEDGSVDTLENIQGQLESEAETVEQTEEPYEATPNSEIEILQEDGSVDTLENIQGQLESEAETVEQTEEPYEATPNSEIEILQEDGSVDTLENIQEQLESEAETVEQIEESYDVAPNSEVEILQENESVDTLDDVQNQILETPDEVEQFDETVDEAVEVQEQLDPHEALSRMGEYYNSHNYGQGDYETYSQDPEWQALNRDLQVANGIEPTEYSEDISEAVEVQEQLDPHEALSRMGEYYNSHNYGQGDYETYSQDPEWQALNRDLQVANGIEPTEYSEDISEAVEVQEQLDPHEALSNMSEYMNAHNYGMEDYETYSQDPEWQALNRDLQVANGIEPTDYPIDIPNAVDNGELIPEVVEREFDDFEKSILEQNPEFYDTGSYYQQGINEFGYQSTCGPTSQANAINQLFGTNEMTENKVLSVAIDNNLCQTHGALDNCGCTSTEQFMELYNKMNEQLGDKFDTELYEYGNVLDANQVAERLENGDVINVAVDACALWDQPREYTNFLGVRQDDFYSDHWITVTGVERMDNGTIKGFDIIDSGGGENYVSLDKYNDMCFGTDEHRVIDPTCIVLSKKDNVGYTSNTNLNDAMPIIQEVNNGYESDKRPSFFDRIFHRKGD